MKTHSNLAGILEFVLILMWLIALLQGLSLLMAEKDPVINPNLLLIFLCFNITSGLLYIGQILREKKDEKD